MKPKPRPKRSEAEYLAHREFVEAAQRQRCCVMCGKAGSDWHPHHVVYEQHLRTAGKPLFDGRNAMRLCVDCHASHHNRSRVIPLSKLTDGHLEHAFEMLGPSAAYYLSKRYGGGDPRLDVWLEKTEEVQDVRSGSAAGALTGTV